MAAVNCYISQVIAIFIFYPFLKNKRIGIYEHSSAGRIFISLVFIALGPKSLAWVEAITCTYRYRGCKAKEDREKHAYKESDLVRHILK